MTARCERDGDEVPRDPRHLTSGYQRALWVVVVLNVGYGLIEGFAGFAAGSQALKADALDFFGDGLITFFGLLAIRWSATWRARAALIQGVFLGALGLGVLGTTLVQILGVGRPEAEVMGIYGGFALLVNIAAALVLLPHRTGDANVRAVWLFSRNDAVGNFVVLTAAGAVSWTGAAWPDLLAAIIIASLFLRSAGSIITEAREDLRASDRTG